jgi:hypothetical protein
MILIYSVNFPQYSNVMDKYFMSRAVIYCIHSAATQTGLQRLPFLTYLACNPVYCGCHPYPSQLNMEVWLDNKNKYDIAINFLLCHLRLIPKFDTFLLSR